MRKATIKQGFNGFIVELESDSFFERPNRENTSYDSTEVYITLKDAVNRLSEFFEEELKGA